MINTQKSVGYLPVIAALFGNLVVMTLKFISAFISGSATMFSEAIHSLADSSNQILLFIGIKRSVKKPSESFIYGYGRERFLWALISACGVFFIGSGVTVYSGVMALINERAIHTGFLTYLVLLIAFVVESFTFGIAWYELKKTNPQKHLRHILKDGDPSSLAVLYEDGLAVIGTIIAFASILLTYITGLYFFDAIGSIIIGVMLGIMALFLINKNREFLIGKAMPDEMKEEIIETLEEDPGIEKVLDFKSIVLDYGIYRVKCEIEFNGYSLLKDVIKDGDLHEEFEIINNNYDEFLRFCVDYSDQIARLMGRRIDELEQKLHKKFPGVKHIDIEVN